MNKRGNIAYLTALFPAVSHTFILREVEALRAAGFDVETTSVRRPGKEHLRGAAELKAHASTYYIIDDGKKIVPAFQAIFWSLCRPKALKSTLAEAWRMRTPGLKASIYMLFYVIEAMLLARQLCKREVDHLHCHFAQSSATVASLAAKLSQIEFSFTLHGPADLYEPYRWHLGRKIANAKFVACISHFARAQAMLFSDPIHWSKLHIIHCGVAPENYATTDRTRDGETTTNYLFVGRLAQVKGVRLLLDAFATARETCPDISLTIVGDGDDRANLERLAAPLGDAVTFTGYLTQDEVIGQFSQSDAFVLPSFAEGLPVVLMEALAAGKPAIAPRVAGIAELIEDGETGYLVHAGDVETLTQRMIEIAQSPEIATAFGPKGQAKIAQDFDIQIEARRLGTLFANVKDAGIRPDPITE